MLDNKTTIETRIKNMKKVYRALDGLIEEYGKAMPTETKEKIKNAILGDDSLNKLLDGVDTARPPRMFLIGRTGVGKSSLINALCSSYVAHVSDVGSCTTGVSKYECCVEGRVLMEIMDSRGTSESNQSSHAHTAEEQLLQDFVEFNPDVAVFVLPANTRDNVDRDVDILNRLKQEYREAYGIDVPVVVVVNKVDAVPPTQEAEPSQYSKGKWNTIDEIIQRYRGDLKMAGLHYDNIIEVSSYINWFDAAGELMRPKEINALQQSEIKQLTIGFDGRYQIDELRDILENTILDINAINGLKMAFKLDEFVHRISMKVLNSCVGAASVVALAPLPLSDIYILSTIQMLMVGLIAALSGQILRPKMAIDFILSLGGVGGIGIALKLTAQQVVKFANCIFGGAGSFVSASIAAMGTRGIGMAAIVYYIDGNGMEEAKKEQMRIVSQNNG